MVNSVNYQVIVRNRTSEIEWEQWYHQCVGSNNTTNSDDDSIGYEWECNIMFTNLQKTVGFIFFFASIILAGVYVWDTTTIKKSCVWKNNDNNNDSDDNTNTNEPTQPKFEKYHDTIIFVSKLFLLLAIYAFIITYAVAAEFTTLQILAIVSVFILALVGYTGIARYRKRPCMDKKTPIQLQAADIFQDFAHTSTAVAVSYGIVQDILLMMFMSSILATIEGYVLPFCVSLSTPLK